MSSPLKKVAIATLDPHCYGGVLSLMIFLYRFLEETGEFAPRLIYRKSNYLEPGFSVTIKSLIKGLVALKPQYRIKMRDEVFQGMRGKAIGAYFPELEFQRYTGNKYWNDATRDMDIFQVVGGANLVGFPFVQLNKKFVVWVATPYYEDRTDRIKHLSLPERVMENISLPICQHQERLIYKKAAKILALSQYTAEAIIKRYGLPCQKVEILPYPIDTRIFCPTGNMKNGNYILCVGRINDPRKNIKMLLKAFQSVAEKKKDVKLFIIGDEPTKDLQNELYQLSLEGRVIFKGRILDKQTFVEYYQNALFFVLPSLQEGLGIVVLEALACGIPVVATKCGGPEMVIKDGENGFLVVNNNPNQLAKAMIYLLEHPELCLKMGENARRDVCENYSVEKIGKRFVEVYQEVYPELF